MMAGDGAQLIMGLECNWGQSGGGDPLFSARVTCLVDLVSSELVCSVNRAAPLIVPKQSSSKLPPSDVRPVTCYVAQ